MNDKYDIDELLNSQRDLTPEEFNRLRDEAEAAWASVNGFSRKMAQKAYAKSDPLDFSECVLRHMTTDQCLEMVHARMYSCPACGRLLKDRG